MKLKTLFLFVVFCLVYAGSAYCDVVKIGLHYGSSSLQSYSVSSEGALDMELDGKSSGSGYNFTVSLGASGISVSGDKSASCNAVRFIPRGGTFKINGNTYRGNVVFRVSNGNLTAINEVDVEQYLYSVVPSEMPPDWHIEALKAQAVCARTYVLKNYNKHSSSGFDLCTSTHCQVYSGIKKENNNSTLAVNETEGEYVTYDMVPIEVYYFASSGGYTESVKNVWSADLPYLVGVEDPYENPASPNYTWTLEFFPSEIAGILYAKGINVGSVTDIQVTKRSEIGSVTEILISGTAGTATFKNEQCRTFLGSKGPLSQNYIVRKGKGGILSSTSGLVDASDMQLLSEFNELYSHEGDTLSTISNRQIDIDVKVDASDNFVFYGSGQGHLVGMSQYGAKSMGELGFTYTQILQHYFTATQILKR